MHIRKSAEPKEWTEYKNIPGVQFSGIPALQESLYREQGYLCAYCERRIPVRDKMLVLPENRVIGFVLLPIRPAELGKTTNTTFTTSNNLRAVARIALLLQGKQQNTTLRQDITPGEISRKCVQGEALFIVVSIAASLMSAWASKRRCPREALYLVVKVVQVVFHVSTLHHSIFRKNQNVHRRSSYRALALS